MVRLWLGIAFVFAATAAGAQEVVITEQGLDWYVGDLLVQLSTIAHSVLKPLIEIGIATIIGMLPFWLRPIASKIARQEADKLLDRGLDWAETAVKGATRQGVVSLPIANKMAKEGAAYILKHGPAWLLKFLESQDKIEQKLLARIPTSKTSEIKTGGKTKAGDVKSIEKVKAAPSTRNSWTLPPGLANREK